MNQEQEDLMSGKMNALVLFAGAGGADIGLRAAGFNPLACVEGDAHACATLRAAGFPAVHAWIGDGPQPERVVRGKAQPPLPVWRHDGQPVDLLWASPPCPPYSKAGLRRGADDARDGWPATLAAIREVCPRWVVIENVAGSPADGWADVLRSLYPEARVWRADAADWGLPSHRDRVYTIAGPRHWTPPRPTHYGPRASWLMRAGRVPWVGFGDALGLDGVRSGAGKRPPRSTVDMPSSAVSATETKGTNYRTTGGPQSPMRASDTLYLATGRRRLTPEECAILCGFPPAYPFQGGKSAAYRQVGNCVAPVMAEVIGRAILEAEKGAAWVPCQCCPEWFCTIHGQHAYDCPCPPVEEWAQTPYL